ncbi:HAMP domain-containing sensor histidine kinase [Chloroflexus sp.]|uniref:sensor histidine kinase n=1 Tax=Chloroflexus sp. TaxID=1904827 RepID=UPI002ADE4E86|nr:HAMP domain-containing sensor histidine kinase [Chloroflexus sp.]
MKVFRTLLTQWLRLPVAKRLLIAGMPLIGLFLAYSVGWDYRGWVVALTILAIVLIIGLWQYFQHRIAIQQQYICELEQELADARTVAAIATRTESAFLTNISHELRTPLNTIIGYSELLHEEVLDEPLSVDEVRERLERIQAAARQLLSLINDIIELARLEAGDVLLNYEPWPIGLLIKEVCATIEPLVEQQQNRLVVDVQPDPEMVVHIDRKKVRQVLFHLLDNAVKFTWQGEINFIVTIRRSDDGTELLICSISDTGVGMTAQQLDLLFAPFTRFDEPLTQRSRGVGIGLTIAHRLCLLMNGTIAVTSKPGNGTTFLITLPLPSGQTDTQSDTYDYQTELNASS